MSAAEYEAPQEIDPTEHLGLDAPEGSEPPPSFAPALTARAGITAGGDAMVCLDIDGTLLGHDGSLSTEVRDAVAALRASGTHVVLATGRGTPGLLPVARELGITSGWAVGSNGAVTLRLDPDLPDGFEVHDVVTFDPAPAVRMLLAEAPDVLVAVEHLGRGFRVTGRFPDGELTGPLEVVGIDELLAEPVARVTLRAPGRSTQDFVDLVQRAGMHGVTYAIGWTAWLDITPDGVSKASALERIRERLGVATSRTLAAGDGQNDREMLRWAALGVAMGNADDGTAACADAVTARVEHDGVVPVLRSLLRG
ncbi:HAD family hydrolase [Litorihabitans aurantiacus]|uniref:Haloacid dehalogenase n=1 Tax=Litorihabitans aurantiacus TaxID=1930061 RepID=A0AA38CSD6_9MICO|nr:HAD family hydrolase [Litorihabitans aurantiacus]GMA33413.1 haloacid dehalogenase [Litorihabitans aurantiacus]